MGERTRWAPGAGTLADSARAIAAVAIDGRSSEDALEAYEGAPQRAAIRAITLGSLRWYLRLMPALHTLVSRPKDLSNEIHSLLIAAAHQIEYSRNVPQATVHATVDATRILKQGRASSLVNAVLRRFVAEREQLLEKLDRSLAVRAAHPAWLVQALERAWPDDIERILLANNEHPPMVLRVDVARMGVEKYLEQLNKQGLSASHLAWISGAVRLDRPVAVGALPGFSEGTVSVQDAGAQLAATLLDVQPHMRVLDACAAPGGKTAHLLERTRSAEVTAVDVDAERLERIRENLQRIGLSATLVAADLRQPESFWNGQPFARILLDAPCSSTGVIRRHPDIKLLRRPADIAAFAATQRQLLEAAFKMLAPGGRLVYATCSILPAENEAVVSDFLAAEPAACVAATPKASRLAPGARDRSVGMQLIPGADAGTDGFYYACIEKTTAGT